MGVIALLTGIEGKTAISVKQLKEISRESSGETKKSCCLLLLRPGHHEYHIYNLQRNVTETRDEEGIKIY